jgi:hypothetical protein
VTGPASAAPPDACTHRTTCLLCGAAALELAVPYPPTPIADAYLRSAEASLAEPRFALDLWLCGACGHLQLADVVTVPLLRPRLRDLRIAGAGRPLRGYAKARSAMPGSAPAAGGGDRALPSVRCRDRPASAIAEGHEVGS